jgi:MFS family permease
LATRVLVGIGEAVYGPAAPALISDLFPVSRRGIVLSVFYAAIPVGAALGFLLGGQALNISEQILGTPNWRWAFYLVVAPGLLFAIWSFAMREPPRGQSHHAKLADYLIILRTPSYVYATLGYTALCFVQGGVGFWTPSYVHVNRGIPNLAWVNSIFGAILVFGGFFSTVLGGLVGDFFRRRIRGSYLVVSGVGALLAFPLLLAFLVVDFPYAWLLIFLVIFWMFFNTGPVNTVLANVVHPSVRASGFALNILVIHLFGDAVSPWIMGSLAGLARIWAKSDSTAPWLAKILGQHDGFDFSIGVTSLFLLAAGILWLMGARHLERDTALAPQRMASQPHPEVQDTRVQTAS